MLRAAGALGVAALLALGVAGGLSEWTGDDLRASRDSHLRKIVSEALSGVPRDNDPLSERRMLDVRLGDVVLRERMPVRLDGAVVAMVVSAEARGYGGAILFAAVFNFPELTTQNLIIIRHRETPGIADFLSTPTGGARALDGVAGATVTARALQNATTQIAQWLRESAPH